MEKVLLPLPPYPASVDMWGMLKSAQRPIVIYGMGNGADKLIDYGTRLGITFADVFASDGFVRGHSFRGMRVKSFTEIKETYSDFIIALSFATSREEVLSLIEEINGEYDLVAPDMPVAGEEYFTAEFYNANYDKIKSVYDLFEDDRSKNIFSSVINYKLSGRINYLLDYYTVTEDIYRLLPENISRIADCGAYNGDTVREAKSHLCSLRRAYAFEPDRRNYNKLLKYAESESDVEVIAKRIALWSEHGFSDFSGSGNRNSSVNATASYKKQEESVPLSPLDDEVEGVVDYIKYDVEGAEREALLGSGRIISESTPALLVSLYHRSRDIFDLPLLVKELCSGYKLYLCRTRCLPAWEISLIAVAAKG